MPAESILDRLDKIDTPLAKFTAALELVEQRAGIFSEPPRCEDADPVLRTFMHDSALLDLAIGKLIREGMQTMLGGPK